MEIPQDDVSHLVDRSIVPVVSESAEVVIPEKVEIISGNDIQDDYELARKTLRELVQTAKDTLDGIVNVAKSSEHPRAFEVAAQLITAVREASKDLLELQKKKAEVSGESPEVGDTNINNAVFVGSTAEFQELLKKKKANIIDG